MTQEPDNHQKLSEAVKTRQERRKLWQREGERSLGQNLGDDRRARLDHRFAHAARALRWPLARPAFSHGDFLDLGACLWAGLTLGCMLAWKRMHSE